MREPLSAVRCQAFGSTLQKYRIRYDYMWVSYLYLPRILYDDALLRWSILHCILLHCIILSSPQQNVTLTLVRSIETHRACRSGSTLCVLPTQVHCRTALTSDPRIGRSLRNENERCGDFCFFFFSPLFKNRQNGILVAYSACVTRTVYSPCFCLCMCV